MLCVAEMFRRINKIGKVQCIQRTVSTCMLHTWHCECSCSKYTYAGTTDLCLCGSTFQCCQSLDSKWLYISSGPPILNCINIRQEVLQSLAVGQTYPTCFHFMHVAPKTVLINIGLRRPVSGELDSNDINETSMAI
jgi:hypothetical protein